jgi:S-adenosylmethionine/arginine decarboxylase-like enzyme
MTHNTHYGMDCNIDLDSCDTTKMTREQIKLFCYALCEHIGMEPMWYHDWEKEGITDADWDNNAHLRGVSACLFIRTSSITVHAIYGTKQVFIDCFSCKEFEATKAVEFSKSFFVGQLTKYRAFARG